MIEESKLKNYTVKGIPFSTAGHDIPDRGSWRVFKPIIDYKRCIRCHNCFLYCPDSCYKIDKKGFTHADLKVCKGCGTCAAVCPVKCIKMERDFHHRTISKE